LTVPIFQKRKQRALWLVFLSIKITKHKKIRLRRAVANPPAALRGSRGQSSAPVGRRPWSCTVAISHKKKLRKATFVFFRDAERDLPFFFVPRRRRGTQLFFLKQRHHYFLMPQKNTKILKIPLGYRIGRLVERLPIFQEGTAVFGWGGGETRSGQ
jgi:hypothetical protein